MILTDKEKAIMKVALTELNIRLSRGLANSYLEDKTTKLWCDLNIHESCVQLLLEKL